MSEQQRLDDVASWYATTGFYGRLVQYGFDALAPHLTGDSCLELGPADGHMTGMLLDRFAEVVSVEASWVYCDGLCEQYGERGLEVVCSLFEDYRPERRFDTVLGTHILEHVEDPVDLLRRTSDWLSADGRVVMLVPNALSIHRIVAVEMGLLPAPNALNELDERLGHRRVYDLDMLVSQFEEAGLEVVETGGNFLKPLANGQIEQWFDERMLEGFYKAGRHFPRHAAEVYVVAKA